MRLTPLPVRPQFTRRRARCGFITPPAAAPRRLRLVRFCTARLTYDETTTPSMSCASLGCRSILGRRLVVIAEVAVLALLLSASAAHAETTQVLALAGSVDEVLTNIRNWVMGILAGLATVFLSIGGVRYVMGGGDPGEIEKAKTSFKAAGMGYGLVALAPLVVTVLQGIVGA
jgi:type IV secretion system pilin